jgi:hypothetical protein
VSSVNVDHYGAALKAIRTRCAEVEVTYEALDEAAGLPARYSAKCLGPRPSKRYSVYSLFLVMAALDLGITMSPLAPAAQTRARIGKRRYRPPARSKSATITVSFGPDLLRNRAQRGGEARARKLSPRRRKSIARKAGQASWRAKLMRQQIAEGLAPAALSISA